MKAKFLAEKAAREATPEGIIEKAKRDAKIAEAEALRVEQEGGGEQAVEESNNGTVNSQASSQEDANASTNNDTSSSSSESQSSSSSSSSSTNPFEATPDTNEEMIYKLKQSFLSFRSEVSSTWDELVKGDDVEINKIIAAPRKTTTETDSTSQANADKYTGAAELMVVNEEDGAWEKMRKRLADSPIIEDLLKNASRASKVLGVDAASKRMGDIGDDAREVWETSQNPWVYRISSVWDTFTAESEFAIATRELRRLDPEFDLEVFKSRFMESTCPNILAAWLAGDTKTLKPQLMSAVYGKLSAEIMMRKKEGVVVDENILEMGDGEIVTCRVSCLRLEL
jgi:import inner membrane translocase subunit TIM44